MILPILEILQKIKKKYLFLQMWKLFPIAIRLKRRDQQW